MKHFEGENNKRHLKGKRRVLAKDELEHDLPSNVYRKRWAKADVTKVQKGNHDEVKKLKIFQQARSEVSESGIHDFESIFNYIFFLTETKRKRSSS